MTDANWCQETLTNANAEPAFLTNKAMKSRCFEMILLKKTFLGKTQVWFLNGQKLTGFSPEEFAESIEQKGVGEIIVQSIDRDGMMNGYDLDLIRRIAEKVTVPVIALGGAGNLSDMKDAYKLSFANGLAAGSMFVYQGARRGVLINYPNKNYIKKFIL